MSTPSPLASPEPWNLVCEGYVAELLESFSCYAQSALDLTALPPDADVVDVAAGPGTLTLLAAQRARHVTAVDFSSAMLAEARRRVEEAGLENVTLLEGNGQRLLLASECCDRAYSMFGLIFFPDQAAGLQEMYRILRPDGLVAIGSWVPFERIPAFKHVFKLLAELMPDLPFGKGKAPLGEADEMAFALGAAGFEDIQVHEVVHETVHADVATFWNAMERSMAPLVLLRKNLGEAQWAPIAEKILAGLRQGLDDGPVRIAAPALIGVGRRVED